MMLFMIIILLVLFDTVLHVWLSYSVAEGNEVSAFCFLLDILLLFSVLGLSIYLVLS